MTLNRLYVLAPLAATLLLVGCANPVPTGWTASQDVTELWTLKGKAPKTTKLYELQDKMTDVSQALCKEKGLLALPVRLVTDEALPTERAMTLTFRCVRENGYQPEYEPFKFFLKSDDDKELEADLMKK